MRKINIAEILVICGAAVLVLSMFLPYYGRQLQTEGRFVRIASALEAYAIDYDGNYPPGYRLFLMGGLGFLTTPVPYLSGSDITDPFATGYPKVYRYINFDHTYRDSDKAEMREQYAQYYTLHGSWLIWSGYLVRDNPATGLTYDPIPYNATNGALSQGTVFRSQRHLSETMLKPVEQKPFD